MYSEHLTDSSRPGWFDVRDFGATGKPGCDNSREIQEALNAAARRVEGDQVERGGTVFFPAGTYDICSGPLIVHSYTNLLGVGPVATKLRAPEHAQNGLFVIADKARYFSFKSLSATSHKGHLWESPGGCSEGVIFNVLGTCYGEDYSLWHQDGDANWMHMLILHNEFSVYAPTSVPAWNIVTKERGLNCNLFQKCRLIDLGERWWELRLRSVSTTDELVDEGHSLVVVALVGTELHIRIFDASGEQVVDKAESGLVAGETLTALKQRLSPFPDEDTFKKWPAQVKQEIMTMARSIAGDTRERQYFFHLERQWNPENPEGSFAYDNAFRDLAFEGTTGGEIRLLSAKSCVIDNCHGYDYHHNGEVVNDLIYIGESKGNKSSEHVVISNSGRRGSSRAISLRTPRGPVDIRLASARYTVLDNINTTPDQELTIDAGNNCTTEIRNLPQSGIVG